MHLPLLLLFLCVIHVSTCIPPCDRQLGTNCMEQRVVSTWQPATVLLHLDETPDFDVLFVMRSVSYDVDMSLQTPNGTFILPMMHQSRELMPPSTLVAKVVFMRRENLVPGNYTVHLGTDSVNPTLASLRVYVQTAKDPLLNEDDRLILQIIHKTCCFINEVPYESNVCHRISLAADESATTNVTNDICRQPPNLCSKEGYIQHLYLHSEEPDGKPGLVCDWDDSFLKIFLKLTVLDLSGNSLSWKLSDLLRADLTLDPVMTSNPTVTATDDTPVAKQPVQLQELYIQHNNMKGGFGDTPSTNIEVLWGFNNRITGPIPNTWLLSQNLAEVILDNNHLTGTLPQFIALEKVQLGLRALHLSANRLQGTMPDFQQYVGSIMSIDVSENRLVGSLPRLPNSVQLLNLGSNMLEGSIQALDASTQLAYASLGSNKLSGTLPAGLATSSSLQVLNLTDNKFTGRLDVGWNGSSLSILLLSKNQFEGPLPVSWLDLPRLEVVQAAYNRFTGTLEAFGAAASNRHTIESVNSSIRILNVSNNELTGPLVPGLKFLDVFNGNVSDSRCGEGNRSSTSDCTHKFDVSENRLSGPFPTWMLDVLPQLREDAYYTFRIVVDSEQEEGNKIYCPTAHQLTKTQMDTLDLAAARGLLCIDSNTQKVVYLSQHILGTMQQPGSSNIIIPPTPGSRKASAGSEARYIAGLVFGCLLVAAAVIAAVLLWLYRTRWYKKNAFHTLEEVQMDVGGMQLLQSTSPRPIP